MTYKLLYKGFDKFDVAFRGALEPIPLATLEAAKREAIEKKEDKILVSIGPGNVDMHVLNHGGRGGYTYVCNTGPFGANWSFKKSQNRADWNISASVQTQALIYQSLEQVFSKLKRDLTGMGAVFDLESINRIDFAMDFLAPEFELDHRNFVAHRRSKVAPYWSEKEVDENQPAAVFAGRRCESVTIGKMPGRQIIIYDKRRASIDKKQLFWFKVWDIDPKDKSKAVWRIELRAGKRHLKDTWRLSTFMDIEASIGDVFEKATDEIRYLAANQTDSNVSRHIIHPIWTGAREHSLNALSDQQSGLTKDQMISIHREHKEAEYAAQIHGLVAGLAVVSGEYPNDEYDYLPDRLHAEILSAISNPMSGFYKAVEKAKKRFHFL